MSGISITPHLPDNYNGPKRRMWCSYCKQNFYVADTFYQRHKPIFYCSNCSVMLSHKQHVEQQTVSHHVERQIVQQTVEQQNSIYTAITQVEHENIVTAKHEYTQLYPLHATSTYNAHEVARYLTISHVGILDAYVVNQFVYVFTVADIQYFIMELVQAGLLEELRIQPLPIALKYIPVTYDNSIETSRQHTVGRVEPLYKTHIKCGSCGSQGLYICKECRTLFCFGHIFTWNNEYYCSLHLPLYNKHQQW